MPCCGADVSVTWVLASGANAPPFRCGGPAVHPRYTLRVLPVEVSCYASVAHIAAPRSRRCSRRRSPEGATPANAKKVGPRPLPRWVCCPPYTVLY